jgi:hypothetical protein
MKTILSCHLLLFSMLLSLPGNAQLVLVTGNILNEKTGNALENVSILESYSGIGTITNMSGFFSLMLKPGSAEVVITLNGFNDLSKKLVLNNDTSLTLSLTPVLNIKAKPKDTEHQKTAEKTEKGNK